MERCVCFLVYAVFVVKLKLVCEMMMVMMKRGGFLQLLCR